MIASESRINKTGVATAPEEAEKTAQGAAGAKPSASGDAMTLTAVRAPYIKEGEPIGSRPLTASGNVPEIFMDKLGERLAFERSGTRLYQSLLGKMTANGKASGGPSTADIEHIMSEEHSHFQLISSVIVQLGGDPTVETPAADLTGVASSGLVQILSDPRTTVAQSLEALLIAELTDNDCWDTLISLAESLGQSDMATEFKKALGHEQEHLERVRGWISEMTTQEAGATSQTSRKGTSRQQVSSRPESKASTKKGSSDPIALLKADHKNVRRMFRDFEKATDADARRSVVEQAITELRVHTEIEEEVFYPAYKAEATKKGQELVAESYEEHQLVKGLMEEMRSLDPSSEQYDATFSELIQNVEHHVKEEEKEMFPDAKKRFGKGAFAELAANMEQRKESLSQAPA
jgi:rubrerythrin/hemerythrin-like domain-containing protein